MPLIQRRTLADGQRLLVPQGSGNMSAAEVAQQLGCASSTLYRHLPGGRSGVEQVAQMAA
jgi:AcrR family transcriptional regulator